MTGNLAWRLAEWTGRVLLVGAVAFWWGAVVIPQLVSMIFPDVLPWSALPRQLNPNLEGTLANTVSAAALAVVALLALGNTVRSLKVQDTRNRIEIGGWAVLAVTAAYLATDEILDFRGSPILYAWGNIALGEAYKGWNLAHSVQPADWGVRCRNRGIRPEGTVVPHGPVSHRLRGCLLDAGHHA